VIDGRSWRAVGAKLVPQALDLSRASVGEALGRLRRRWLFILQCALAAGVAWWFARVVLGHPTPFFAPVTAVISLGFSYGHRIRRAFEVMAGVAVGVFVGDLFINEFGSGYWQLVVIAFLAMTIATLVNAGNLITIQAGVQSIIVATLVAAPDEALSRWIDAIVGGGVAIAFTLVAPAAPVHRPRQRAAEVLREIAAILRDTVAALRTGDSTAANSALDRARRSEGLLVELRSASDEGVAVVRYSPLRRRHLPAVLAIADLLEPLDRTVRNLRVLVRRSSVALWRGERVPSGYVAVLSSLAEVTDEIANELEQRRLPTGTRPALVMVGELSAIIDPSAGLSGEVMRAQIRSMVVDLLTLTGLDHSEAVEMVPDTHSVGEVSQTAEDAGPDR
jgi:uncharacterized membrane protein YgaE (UPF0421/DUF939 family)